MVCLMSDHNHVHFHATYGLGGEFIPQMTSVRTTIFWFYHAFVDEMFYKYNCQCGDEYRVPANFGTAEINENTDVGSFKVMAAEYNRNPNLNPEDYEHLIPHSVDIYAGTRYDIAVLRENEDNERILTNDNAVMSQNYLNDQQNRTMIYASDEVRLGDGFQTEFGTYVEMFISGNCDEPTTPSCDLLEIDQEIDVTLSCRLDQVRVRADENEPFEYDYEWSGTNVNFLNGYR